MNLNQLSIPMSQNILADQKESKVKYKLRYGSFTVVTAGTQADINYYCSHCVKHTSYLSPLTAAGVVWAQLFKASLA